MNRMLMVCAILGLALSACTGPSKRNAAECVGQPPCAAAQNLNQARYAWQPRQIPREPAVFDAAMCYDAKRGECVSLGGYHRWAKAANKTHVWDGSRWQERETDWPGEGIAQSAMAYDSRRGVVVMFGGHGYNSMPMQRTCEWDGQSWITVGAAPLPPARYGHCMAFDEKRGVTVLFGGRSDDAAPLTDVWEWDGTSWRGIACEVAPMPTGGAMAYHAGLGLCIFFGGRPSIDGARSDTWTWNGTTWKELACKDTPGPRAEFAMAYDANVQGVVLVGEGGVGEARRYKTWEFTDSGWRRLDCAGPSYRLERHSLAYDSKRKRLVLHGGNKGGGGRDDTWEFDGGSWTDVTGRCTPSPDGERALFYDSARKVTYLLGVNWDDFGEPGNRSQMWAWNGECWSIVNCKHVPSRGEPAVAFDEERGVGVCLVFTGTDSSRQLEVWEWDGRDWAQAGCEALQRETGDSIRLFSGPPRIFYDPLWRETFSLDLFPHGKSHRAGQCPVYSWDGKRWRLRDMLEAPAASGVTEIAYAAKRRTLVQLTPAPEGGYDTYEYDWRSWRKHSGDGGPFLSLGGRSLVANNANGTTMCFGCGFPTGERHSYDFHWEWDGCHWIQPDLLLKPGPRHNALTCYNCDRQSVVLWGGADDAGQLYDTWEYGPQG